MLRPAAAIALPLALATIAALGPRAAAEPTGLSAAVGFSQFVAQTLPQGDTPDPGPSMDPLDGAPEELTPPEGAANEPTEEQAQQVLGYNAANNPWLPVCTDQPQGWLPELPIPQQLLDCKCDGVSPGRPCRIWRSLQKPTHASVDKECVVCVKEPCLGYKKECYEVEAVVQKCFEHDEPFCDEACEEGRWIQKKGTKVVRQLHPCKAKVKLFYWKPVVEYRDVYYYISSERCHDADTAVAQR